MNAGHTCLFSQRVLNGVLRSREEKCGKNRILHKGNMLLREKLRICQKNPARKKIAFEFLHQRLGHRSTRSFLAGDTDNFWEDEELRIYPDPFCTSCQIYSMNKKARSKIPLNPKAPFKWVLWI